MLAKPLKTGLWRMHFANSSWFSLLIFCAVVQQRSQGGKSSSVLPGEVALQLKEGHRSLGSRPVSLGVLSNSNEVWTVHRQPPRGLLVVVVASLTVQSKDRAAQVGAGNVSCPLSLVQRGTASFDHTLCQYQ